MVKGGNQCQLNNFGMIQDHLKQFGHKKGAKSIYQCSLCGKSFDNEDYLEFHMKQGHFRAEKMQMRYHDRGMICPADLCDFFECPELSEKILRTQVYKERTDGNYEGKPDFRNGKNKKDRLSTFRYEMSQHYDESRKATLLQKCHRVFLDCVDYSTSTFENVIKAYDFYSQMYCAKFEPSGVINEEDAYDLTENLGIYKMKQEIRDEKYSSPLSTLKDATKQSAKNMQATDILWLLSLVITLILGFVYSLAIYFTYYENPQDF